MYSSISLPAEFGREPNPNRVGGQVCIEGLREKRGKKKKKKRGNGKDGIEEELEGCIEVL